MTECNQCGDCCEVIPFYMTKEELLQTRYRDWQNQYNVAFIYEHWHTIRKDHPRYKELFGLDEAKYYLMTCDMWDKETRLCTAHENRPAVCSDYPWYNNDPGQLGSDPYLSKNCSFWVDVPVSIKNKSVAFQMEEENGCIQEG